MMKQVHPIIGKLTAFVWFLFMMFFFMLCITAHAPLVDSFADNHPVWTIGGLVLYVFLVAWPVLRSGFPFIDPPCRYIKPHKPLDLSDVNDLLRQAKEKSEQVKV